MTLTRDVEDGDGTGAHPPRRLRRAWAIWVVALLATAGYVGAAHVASRPTLTTLTLRPGETATANVFSLVEDVLRFELEFRANGWQQRPELGEWATREHDGLLELRPGALVRIVARVSASPPVEYDAMPVTAYTGDAKFRRMTSNLPVRPGVYRWPPPPDSPTVPLHRGANTVRFEVAAVDAPLVDESVILVVLPPLGFKTIQASVSWLWYAHYWPAVIPVFAIWTFVLIAMGWRVGSEHGA